MWTTFWFDGFRVVLHRSFERKKEKKTLQRKGRDFEYFCRISQTQLSHKPPVKSSISFESSLQKVLECCSTGQLSLPVSHQLCLFAFFLFSLLTGGVSYPRSVSLFRQGLIFSKTACGCLGIFFSDQLEALQVVMHIDASIVGELSLWLTQ